MVWRINKHKHWMEEFTLIVVMRKGRTIRKVMGGGWGGGWGIFSLDEFCFSLTALICRNFFFRWNPLHEFFFQTNIAFFDQWNLDSLSMFLCFINYSILTTDQRIQATLMQNLFENVHTGREEEATLEWTASLCIFSVPALPQPIIMMPYSIHQNNPSVVPSTPKRMSIQKEGTCLIKVKYYMIVKSYLLWCSVIT